MGSARLFFFIFFYSFSSWSQELEVDYLSLARMLVKDGHYYRAEKTLEKWQTTEAAEKAISESLWGLIELHKKNFKKALTHFEKSVQLNVENPEEVYIYQAEASLRIKDFKQSLIFLDKVVDANFKKLPYFLIRSEIYWQNGQKKKSWQVLEQASRLGFSRNILIKKKFSYLLDEGLYQSAFQRAQDLILNADGFQDVLMIASQLRQKGQFDLSLRLLQTLKVLRPKKETVALEMAQNYLAKSESFSATLVLEEAAKLNPSLSYEASELLRQQGKAYRARFLNMSTLDEEKRLKQSLSLYLEEDDYISSKFMIPQLKKHKLLEDQNIRYAVAYSLFKTGDFDKSKLLLNSIDNESLFQKSIELKKEIHTCKDSNWACHETI